MKNLNVNEILKNNLLSVINKKGYANLLLFDTETTGIIKPIYISQLGYILIQITQDKITHKLIFKEIIEMEKDYYVEKEIEPQAVYITNIIREEDLENKEYMKKIYKVYEDENKQKKQKIKKEFKSNEANILKKELGFFDVNDIKVIEKDGIEYEIDFYSGHNLYEYDFKNVLTNTYNFDVKPDIVFDTLYYNMNARKKNCDRISKTKQGRNLNNTVTDIISTIKDKEYLEEISKLMEEREHSHSALLDIKVNLIATKYQIEQIVSEDYKNCSSIDFFEMPENNKITKRQYGKGDILYVETNMSKNNIITINDIVSFVKDKDINKVILIDKNWSNSVLYVDMLKKNDIDVYIGLKALNVDDNEYYDILVGSTNAYRHLMTIVEDFKTVSNTKIEDLKRETNCIIIPSKKMPVPKYYDKTDAEIYYLLSSSLENDVMTIQEKEIFLNKTQDLSLKTGLFTSNVQQKWLKETMESKNYEKIDFYFYEKLNLSAFPPLTILSDFVKEEPKDINGYIEALETIIDKLFYKGEGKNTIENVLATTTFTKKDYQDRIQEEITVLKSTGNSDYVKYFFLMYKNKLIIEEELNKISISVENKNKLNNILKIDAYGPGRGSAAGSLIAFILGITDTNPLKYDLLFERFINPERVSMPDIDVDIQDKELYYNILSEYYNREMQKIMDYNQKPFDIYSEYIINKYIKNKKDFVGKISALSYTTKKTILANIVRLNALPYFIQTSISREFVEDKSVSLYDNVMNSSVREEILTILSEDVLNKLDVYGNKGNKLFSNYGLHAAGVLFYPYHAAVMTPTLEDNVTIWDGNYIEAMFLVKMDYLGLSTKAAIDEIRKKIYQDGYGKHIFQNNKMELDNPESLKAMAEGKTSMTFQMESASARRILNKLAPLVFDDIIAANALNRPGPLGSGAVDDYISASIEAKRKKYNFNYYPVSEYKKLNKETLNNIIEKIKIKMSSNYIEFEDGTTIDNLKKGENNILIDNNDNKYYINEKKLIKKSKDSNIEEMPKIKEFHIGFNELLLTNTVIENLLTLEPYFESAKFNQKITELYDNLEYLEDESELYKLNKEHNCKNIEEFNTVLINDVSFFNYLNYEEIDFNYEKVIEELSLIDFEKKEKYYHILSSNNDNDLFKFIIKDYKDLTIAKDLGVEKYVTEYFNKIYNLYDNLEYAGGLPIYKRIFNSLKCKNEDDFKEKILTLEKNIKTHPLYYSLTKETYSTIVYQEQIMKISMNMAGYTKGESDNLRKAIAKQKKDMMNLHKKKLIEGLTSYSGDLRYLGILSHLIVRDNKDGTIVVTNTIEDNRKTILKGKVDIEGNIILTDDIKKYEKIVKNLNLLKAPLLTNIEARYLWEKIEKFGEYAFNKSHSASYSILSYETQYYKEKFPLIAYSILLKHVPEKHKQSLLAEIKNSNIKVELQPIDENLSLDYLYSYENNSILLPISHVKSLGEKDLFPVIALVKEYHVNTMEEYIILQGSVPKTTFETFGVLGMFGDKENVSISQIEWYYSLLYDEKMKEDNKKYIPLVVKRILEKSFKHKDFVKEYKKMYSELNIEENVSELFELLKDIKIITNLYMFDYLKKKFNVVNVDNKSGGENYTSEYIKLKSTFDKNIDKLKVSDEYKEYIRNKIKIGNHLFFKETDFYKKFVEYKINKVKYLSIKLKEIIKVKKEEELLEEIIKNEIKNDKTYKYDLSKKYTKLPSVLQQIIYEIKLKEGNPFQALPDYQNGTSVNFIDLDSFKNRTNQSTETKQYRTMMNIAENINNNNGVKINLAIITDFMPKCNKIGKYNQEYNGRMTMKEHFKEVFDSIPIEKREYINPIWISLFEETKEEAETIDESTGISLLQNEKYVNKRIEEVFEKIIKSDIHHIILAMPKKSILREKITFQQYKTFQNQNGTKYIKYRTKDGTVVNNKLVSFIDSIFPYDFLQELYILRAQQLLDILNVDVNFFEYLKNKKKNSKVLDKNKRIII